MAERHYIEWMEVVVQDGVTDRFSKPNGDSEIAFEIEGDILQVRTHCSIHGLLTEKEA